MELGALVKQMVGKVFGFPEPKESYFDRWMRLKPVVESNEELLSNIESAFDHEYTQGELSEGVYRMGSGDMHVLYYVGKIRDPLTQRPIHLTIRLGQNDEFPYRLGGRIEKIFSGQMYEFENVFNKKDNPPYTAGTVSWKKGDDIFLGFLVEDVSENRNYILRMQDLIFLGLGGLK